MANIVWMPQQHLIFSSLTAIGNHTVSSIVSPGNAFKISATQTGSSVCSVFDRVMSTNLRPRSPQNDLQLQIHNCVCVCVCLFCVCVRVCVTDNKFCAHEVILVERHRDETVWLKLVWDRLFFFQGWYRLLQITNYKRRMITDIWTKNPVHLQWECTSQCQYLELLVISLVSLKFL